jgi:hypothetical protein
VNVYGNIVTGKMVRNAVIAHVRTWAPDYIAEMGARDGRDRTALPSFRSYTSKMNDPDKFVEDQIPCCVVVAPGMVSGKIARRARTIDAQWAVGLAAVVSGQDEDNTYELAELYTAALRSLMIQHPGVGGLSTGVTLLSERYVPLDANGTRTLAAGIVQLGVDVQAVVDSSQGPSQPSGDVAAVPPEWPVIETVDTQVLAGVDGT